MNLTVDVAEAHFVEIDKGQSPHAGSGQGFYRPGTHAADPHHTKVQVPEEGVSVIAVQAAKTREADIVVVDPACEDSMDASDDDIPLPRYFSPRFV